MKSNTRSFGTALFLIIRTSLILHTGRVSAVWNASRNNNLVVYWGQNAHGSYNPTDDKQQKDLLFYCQDPNIDVIPIGFLSVFNGEGGEPTVNFANSCRLGTYFPGTKLLGCPTIGQDITACQKKYGKKILLSIGGALGEYTDFKTVDVASAFANKLWNMFGKGTSNRRPFGEATIDGFDLDIEHEPARNYEALAIRLRKLMDTDTATTGKQWLLTAAPQCPLPDKYMNTALTRAPFDAVFVQFYNNPYCQADQWVSGKEQLSNTGFNFGAWDAWAKGMAKNKNIKVFLTLPATAKVGRGGVSKTVAATVVGDLRKYSSFGGAALWDASEAWTNTGLVPELKIALNKGVVTVKSNSSVTNRSIRRRRGGHRHGSYHIPKTHGRGPRRWK